FALNVLHRCLKFQQKVAVPGQEALATHCIAHSRVHAMAHIGVNPNELGVGGRIRARIHGRDDLKKKVLLVSSKFKGALTVGHDDVSFKCSAPVPGQGQMMSLAALNNSDRAWHIVLVRQKALQGHYQEMEACLQALALLPSFSLRDALPPHFLATSVMGIHPTGKLFTLSAVQICRWPAFSTSSKNCASQR